MASKLQTNLIGRKAVITIGHGTIEQCLEYLRKVGKVSDRDVWSHFLKECWITTVFQKTGAGESPMATVELPSGELYNVYTSHLTLLPEPKPLVQSSESGQRYLQLHDLAGEQLAKLAEEKAQQDRQV